MSRVSLVVIALVVGSPPASAQTPPPGGVFGRVLAAATGQPIRRAQVTLTIPGSNPSFRQREHRRRRPLPSSPICFIDAANASYDFGTAGKAHTNVDIVVSNSARVRLVRATPDGAFRAGHLPPGEYWVRAITVSRHQRSRGSGRIGRRSPVSPPKPSASASSTGRRSPLPCGRRPVVGRRSLLFERYSQW